MNILSAVALTYITSPQERAAATRTYQVYDRHTDLNVGTPLATRAAASRKVDRLDNAYGAYRYGVR